MTEKKSSKWWKDFKKVIEENSGMTTIGSSAISVVGGVAAGPWGLFSGAAGVAIAVVYAGIKSYPAPKKSPADLIGKKLSFEDLVQLDTNPLLLAVVGASQSGKSTFLSTAQHNKKPSTRTNKVQGEIMMLPGKPPDYIALLDADGKEFYQQFELVEKADFIVLFIDHNKSSVDKQMSEERLKEHDNFIEQVEPVLKKRKNLPKIHLLFNKRDLWENESDSDYLKSWFEKHAAEWKRRNISKEFTYGYHTNMTTDDTATMMEVIRGCVKERGLV